MDLKSAVVGAFIGSILYYINEKNRKSEEKKLELFKDLKEKIDKGDLKLSITMDTHDRRICEEIIDVKVDIQHCSMVVYTKLRNYVIPREFLFAVHGAMPDIQLRSFYIALKTTPSMVLFSSEPGEMCICINEYDARDLLNQSREQIIIGIRANHLSNL